jgi:hypothetical protein
VQVSGLKWAYDVGAPFGNRVTRACDAPRRHPDTLERAVEIATNNFMASGGDQFTTLTQG